MSEADAAELTAASSELADDGALFPHLSPPPRTGDTAIDEALGQLHDIPPTDLDGQARVGQRVFDVLHSRLDDLGAR